MLVIWSEVLGIDKDRIGIDADFFQLGGHSLKATALISRINLELKAAVPLVEFFKFPTVKSLSEYIIRTKEEMFTKANNLTLLKRGQDISRDGHLFFIHGGTGDVESYLEFCKHFTPQFNCWGLRVDRPENLAPRNITIQELANTYIKTIKKVQPHGPYYVAGWSLGGTIAFEIASQLEQKNDDISFLALIDSPAPSKNLWKNKQEFDMNSESSFLKGLLKDKHIELDKTLNSIDKIEHFWPQMIAFLEAHGFDVELVRKISLQLGMHILPNFSRLNFRESIDYINTIRTLNNARAAYIPVDKINTRIHYFGATKSKGQREKLWEKYTTGGIIYNEIEGDHFSILRTPRVTILSGKFAKAIITGGSSTRQK